MPLFITFEGTEGCGKSTQIRRLAEALQQRGLSVHLTREPGGTPLADRIRQLLLDPDSDGLVPMAELLLYLASRAQHVQEIIRPALARGEIVLCDRFTDATRAYQGFGRGLDEAAIETLNRLATDGLEPDLTLWLDLPVEEGLQRSLRRHADSPDSREDRLEREALAFHQRLYRGYAELARRFPHRIRRIDAGGSPDEVFDRILQAVPTHGGMTP